MNRLDMNRGRGMSRRAMLVVSLFLIFTGFSSCPQAENPGAPPAEDPGPPPVKNPGALPAITGFAFEEFPAAAVEIDGDAKSITVTIPYSPGFNPGALTPVFTLGAGWSLTISSGTQNFSRPRFYTLTDGAGAARRYTVTVYPLFTGLEGLAGLEDYVRPSGSSTGNDDTRPFYIALEGLDLSAAGVIKSIGEALLDQYAALDLSRCTGDTLTGGSHIISVGAVHGATVSYFRFAVSVILPDAVKTTGDYSFAGCNYLVSVLLPKSLEVIESYAFFQSLGFTGAKIPDTVKIIGDSAFANSGLEAIELPAGLTGIGNSAFVYTNLKTITLPSKVRNLGTGVFLYCSSLENADFSASRIISLGSMFQGCTSLKTLALPPTLTNISWDALGSCTALETLAVYAEQPPVLGTSGKDALENSGAEDLTIYVPEGSISAYQAADGWKEYLIKSLSELP